MDEPCPHAVRGGLGAGPRGLEAFACPDGVARRRGRSGRARAARRRLIETLGRAGRARARRRLSNSVGNSVEDPRFFMALRPSPQGVWVEISVRKTDANFHQCALWGRGESILSTFEVGLGKLSSSSTGSRSSFLPLKSPGRAGAWGLSFGSLSPLTHGAFLPFWLQNPYGEG